MKYCIFALGLMACTSPALATTDYMTVERTVEVNRSADEGWKRIGNFCGAGELLDLKCEIVSGDGGVGTVRGFNGTILEPMVAKTRYSYTYSQIQGSRANTDYHGTLAIEPIDSAHSRIVYTLVIDAARLPAGTDKEAYRKTLETRFQGAIDRAKGLIEAQ